MLDTYKPLVWEYARLNITHNVLSKRKLNRLVTQGFVHGWDDPRLLTLAGLRRRGVQPEVSALLQSAAACLQAKAGSTLRRNPACGSCLALAHLSYAPSAHVRWQLMCGWLAT